MRKRYYEAKPRTQQSETTRCWPHVHPHQNESLHASMTSDPINPYSTSPVQELTPVHEAYELASSQEPVTPLGLLQQCFWMCHWSHVHLWVAASHFSLRKSAMLFAVFRV